MHSMDDWELAVMRTPTKLSPSIASFKFFGSIQLTVSANIHISPSMSSCLLVQTGYEGFPRTCSNGWYLVQWYSEEAMQEELHQFKQLDV
ncbi:hypothetical protein Tco_0665542 [Tanacetum coccineum]